MLLRGEVEERRGTGMERRAVEEHERRFAREPRGQPVPHHPTGRRVVEEAVAGAQIGVQPLLLQVLEQRAAGAVHDALGRAGRAGGVEHVERVIEGQPRELDLTRGEAAGELVPARRAAQTGERRASREIPRHHAALHRRQLREHRGDALAHVVGLAAVGVAVAGEEHARLDLAEAVERRPARRSPASTTTRSRRDSPPRASRRSPPRCSAGSPRRDRRAARPARAAPAPRATPRRGAPPR